MKSDTRHLDRYFFFLLVMLYYFILYSITYEHSFCKTNRLFSQLTPSVFYRHGRCRTIDTE